MKPIRRKTWCPLCNQDHDVVLVGSLGQFHVCKVCTQASVTEGDFCPHCGSKNLKSVVEYRRPSPVKGSQTSDLPTRVPLVCIDCQERFLHYVEAVADGGLYIACKRCGHLGYMIGGSLADRYRQRMNTPTGPGAVVVGAVCESCVEPDDRPLPIALQGQPLPKVDPALQAMFNELFPIQKLEVAPAPEGDNVVDFAAFKARKGNSG